MAQKLDDRPDQDNIYDDNQPSWRQHQTPDDLEESFNAPSATDADLPDGHPDKNSSASPEQLQAAEQSGGASPATKADAGESSQLGGTDDQIGSGYKGGSKSSGVKARFSRRKKLIGGGVAGIFGGGIIGFILVFFPTLRLESYMSRINDRAFSYASNAVESRLSRLFERYMIGHALDLESCGNVINDACRASYSNKGLAGGLFQTWRDAKIENKLKENYGIRIESHKNPDIGAGTHRFTLTDSSGRQIRLTSGDIENGNFTGGDRVLGREFRKFLKEETRWYQVMERRSVRSYLSRKHGVKLWCFWACERIDDVELSGYSKVTQYKYKFVERFVYPFSGKYGFIMDCLISSGGDKCKAESLRSRGIDRDVIPDADVDEIVRRFANNQNQRLSQYIIERLVSKVISQQAGRVAARSIPVAGWIYFGVTIVDMLDSLDGYIENNGLSHFAADLNARQYLEYYTAMRSINDEMKSGEASLDEVGAVLGDFEGAEESLVYQANNSTTTVASLFGDKVAAAASQDTYVCDDGEPIPAGQLVCKEKKVTRTFLVEEWRDNSVVDDISGLLNGYACVTRNLLENCPWGASPRTYIKVVLTGINFISDLILGTVTSVAFSIARSTPLVGDYISLVEEKLGDLMNMFFNIIFPLPIDADSPGREKYDGLEAGAEVASSEFGKGGYTESGESYGLGAVELSTEQATAIQQDYLQQQEYETRNMSFFAKLTDLKDSNSIMNNVLAIVPTRASQIPDRIAAVISNLPGSFMNVFSALGTKPASAAHNSQHNESPFGITRYGYPVNDPVFNTDPDVLTEEYCQEAKKAREDSMTENELTGFDEYSVSDPCLLEEVAIEAAGAFFTND